MGVFAGRPEKLNRRGNGQFRQLYLDGDIYIRGSGVNLLGKQFMTKEESEHIQAVVDLGCIACRMDGIITPQVEVHHIRAGVGKGQRASHYDVLPLCYQHHRGIAGYHKSPKRFEERYGREHDLLREVYELLGEYDGRKVAG